MNKTCTKCGEVKPLDNFYADKSKKSGYRTDCKKCTNAVRNAYAKRVREARPEQYLLRKVWSNMVQRCTNPNHPRYKDYGGRGIKICKRWRSFKPFLEDMQPSYKKGLTIDRINNEGNYEPTNCRWATWKQQNNNQRGRIKPSN